MPVLMLSGLTNSSPFWTNDDETSMSHKEECDVFEGSFCNLRLDAIFTDRRHVSCIFEYDVAAGHEVQRKERGGTILF